MWCTHRGSIRWEKRAPKASSRGGFLFFFLFLFFFFFSFLSCQWNKEDSNSPKQKVSKWEKQQNIPTFSTKAEAKWSDICSNVIMISSTTQKAWGKQFYTFTVTTWKTFIAFILMLFLSNFHCLAGLLVLETSAWSRVFYNFSLGKAKHHFRYPLELSTLLQAHWRMCLLSLSVVLHLPSYCFRPSHHPCPSIF